VTATASIEDWRKRRRRDSAALRIRRVEATRRLRRGPRREARRDRSGPLRLIDAERFMARAPDHSRTPRRDHLRPRRGQDDFSPLPGGFFASCYPFRRLPRRAPTLPPATVRRSPARDGSTLQSQRSDRICKSGAGSSAPRSDQNWPQLFPAIRASHGLPGPLIAAAFCNMRASSPELGHTGHTRSGWRQGAVRCRAAASRAADVCADAAARTGSRASRQQG
jgi:hypothetical protein